MTLSDERDDAGKPGENEERNFFDHQSSPGDLCRRSRFGCGHEGMGGSAGEGQVAIALQRPIVEQEEEEWKCDEHGLAHQAESKQYQCEPVLRARLLTGVACI